MIIFIRQNQYSSDDLDKNITESPDKSKLTSRKIIGTSAGLVGGSGLGFLVRSIEKEHYGIDKLKRDYSKFIDSYKKYYGVDGDKIREAALKNYNKTYNKYKQFLDKKILSKKNIPIAIGSVLGSATGFILTSNNKDESKIKV